MLSVSQYLDRVGVGLAQVPTFVRPLAADEALLLVGSVGEGLANHGSDLDLLLIERSPAATSRPSDTVRAVPAGFDLNVELVAHASIAALAERFVDNLRAAEAPAEAQQPRPTSFVGDDDLRMLHRLRTGIVLHDPSALVAELRARARLDALPELCVVQHVACHLRLCDDAEAALAVDADRATPLLMCALAARRLVAAVLAAIGETNPSPKWAMRLLWDHAAAVRRFEPAALTALALVGAELEPHGAVARLRAISGQTLARLSAVAHEGRWAVAPTLLDLTKPDRRAPERDALAG